MKKKYKIQMHGMTGTKMYWLWRGMMARCDSPTHTSYKDYGGRGIRVCKRWRIFNNFFADMGEKPKGMSLDRINNNKGYSPKNCRWSTMSDQLKNARSTNLITINGVTKCCSDWAREVGIGNCSFLYRVRQGWPVSELLSPPNPRIKRVTKP